MKYRSLACGLLALVSSSADAQRALLVSERTTGLTKQCFYEFGPSIYSATVKSHQLCPFTLSVSEPRAIWRDPGECSNPFSCLADAIAEVRARQSERAADSLVAIRYARELRHRTVQDSLRVALFVERATLVLQHALDSIELGGAPRARAWDLAWPLYQRLFAAYPTATNQQMRDEIDGVVRNFGRQNNKFMDSVRAAIRQAYPLDLRDDALAPVLQAMADRTLELSDQRLNWLVSDIRRELIAAVTTDSAAQRALRQHYLRP